MSRVQKPAVYHMSVNLVDVNNYCNKVVLYLYCSYCVYVINKYFVQVDYSIALMERLTTFPVWLKNGPVAI